MDLLFRESFTLHARRFQVPSAECTAGGLGISDASVGNARIVGTELHVLSQMGWMPRNCCKRSMKRERGSRSFFAAVDCFFFCSLET